jgi:hypothetical protein
MTRFRPTIEPLDARTLPSAVVLLPDAPASGAVQFADESGESAPGDVGVTTATSDGKVTMQDFHFVTKVNKASPALFLS